MCYAGGPRCSKSAKAAMERAFANGSHNERMKALDEYRHTPEGIAATKQINPQFAEQLQRERDAMLRARQLNDSQIERSERHLRAEHNDDNAHYYRKAEAGAHDSIIDSHGQEMNGDRAPYPNGYPHTDVLIDKHFQRQMHEKGFTPAQVIEAIKKPYKVTKVMAHPGQWRYCGGGVAVVMDRNRCVTIYEDGKRTPLRKDQMNDPRALNSKRVGIVAKVNS